MSEDGWKAEPLDLAFGVCSVDVSSEDQAARTDGRSHVFLLVWGERSGREGLTGTVMTGDEARELARRLLLAADLCP